MEYSSLLNHLLNFSNYSLGFCILLIIYPFLIFRFKQESLFESIVSNYIRMVFLIIVCGYVLVIIKLFEMIGIFIVFGCIYFLSLARRRKSENTSEVDRKKTLFFDYIDGVRSYKDDFIISVRKFFAEIKSSSSGNINNKMKLYTLVIFIVTIAYSCYLRFYDAYKSAAPGMSDGAVTLAWMKYISARELFHDGIYPQGFHIYLATLHKFTGIDALYILKYTGPLNGVFICLGMYFLVSRITERKLPGILAAFLFGVLGSFFTSGWERQAATNSQEFAYVFILPTLYFLYKFLKNNKKKDLLTGFSGLCVIGLVHTVAYVFVLTGAVVLAFSGVLINLRKYFRRDVVIAVCCIISGIIAVIPMGVGLLMGKPINESSQDFATSKLTDITVPELRIIDYIGFACIVIILLYIIVKLRKREEQFSKIFIFLLGSAAFAIFYYGAIITKSVVVQTRFPDLWTLVIPVVAGTAIAVLGQAINWNSLRHFCELGIIALLLLSTVAVIKPQPIVPYKMEYSTNEEQYLRISSTFRPTEWMIVSQLEGYAVVLLKGFHMYMNDLVNNYDPSKKIIENSKTGAELNTQDIFIFHEKTVFTTQFKDSIHDYEQRKIDNEKLVAWIEVYKANHQDKNGAGYVETYYEDENMTVYRIHQNFDQQENFDTIWNSNQYSSK